MRCLNKSVSVTREIPSPPANQPILRYLRMTPSGYCRLFILICHHPYTIRSETSYLEPTGSRTSRLDR